MQHPLPSLESEVINLLIQKAKEAQTRAYAPYSNYPVGAALLVTSGKIYLGCNVENASFGATVCAERVAASSAIAKGHNHFVAMAIISPSNPPATPCGICRQFLSEFAPRLPLILSNLDGKTQTLHLNDIFPSKFSIKDLQAK